MAWPTYTIADLSSYSGRPEASYPSPYSTTSIAKSLLLFKLYTCLKDWPTDPDEAELAKYAVLSAADMDVLAQPHVVVLSGPFQSENLGSYGYSLKAAQKQLALGMPTGLTWFDEAIQRLSVCESGPGRGVDSDSIKVFEDDGLFLQTADGKKTLLGPKDWEPTEFHVVYDPSQGQIVP